MYSGHRTNLHQPASNYGKPLENNFLCVFPQDTYTFHDDRPDIDTCFRFNTKRFATSNNLLSESAKHLPKKKKRFNVL